MSTTVATIRPVPESGGDAAETLPQALGRLRVALNDAFEACSQELGLTAQQCELLCAVQRPGTVGGLAQALHCDRSNVSRLVDRVSSRGLVRRRRGEDDGRVTVVELTAGGERLALRFLAALEERSLASGARRAGGREVVSVPTLNAISDALGARPRAPGRGRRPPPPHLGEASDR